MKDIESIDYWYKLVVIQKSFDQELIQKMYTSLKTEYPSISTMMLEQTCNLNCEHCFFKPEHSSRVISFNNKLEETLIHITKQLPKGTSIVDGGRILREWHIPLLEKLRNTRKDITIGMVDNGTYLKLEEQLKKSPFRFDWIDISIDGTKETHNLQRRDKGAYNVAIEGLMNAREFILPKWKGGKVTSLFSASKHNYLSLAHAASSLISTAHPLIDEFHITPVSPIERNKHILMNEFEFAKYWEQVKKVFEYGKQYGVKIFTRLYQARDIEFLASAVGEKKFSKSIRDVKNIAVGRGAIQFITEGVPVIYVPMSICPSETFLINPDGYYRLAYSIQFTLDELHSGKSSYGENTIPYTVAKIDQTSSFKKLYRQGAIQWKENFGLKYLQEEINLFKTFN